MSYVIPPSQGVIDEQRRCLGEAVRLLHRAGWHDTAKHIAEMAAESGLCVDDGKRLVQSWGATTGEDCAVDPAAGIGQEGLRATGTLPLSSPVIEQEETKK